MKKSELQEIAEMLLNNYGEGRHFEIIKAEKMGHYEGEVNGWRLEVCKIEKTPAKTNEGAENESNK